MIRLQRAKRIFRFDLDEIIELVFSDVARRCDAERFEQIRRSCAWLLERRREIELDPAVALLRGQKPALGVKFRHLIRTKQLFFPQRVCAGQRGMTAKGDFDGGREPAQRPAVVSRQQKRCFGEIHLRADVLHPLLVALAVEETDRCRIALERLVGERVDLEYAHELPVTGGRLPEDW